MNKTAKKWITFTIRWGVAVAGIWYVLAQTPFHDELLIYPEGHHHLARVRVLDEPAENAQTFRVIADPKTGLVENIPRGDVWTRPDTNSVVIEQNGEKKSVKLLAIRPGVHYERGAMPAELLVTNPTTGKPMRVPPTQAPDYKVGTPYPLVDIGVFRLVQHARLGFLLAALMVLPVSYLITSRRWHMLLEALDIHMAQTSTFVLNMVGSFYNTFMPGSTGGDLVKAYYAAKHTTHKVRAVLSVIVDRLIGVMALIILGGAMCVTQWDVKECRRVGLVSAVIIFCVSVGLIVYYHRGWREATGLAWLLKRMPMQKQVHHAVEAMDLYGKRPKAAFLALVMTFPVHMTTIVCGTLVGAAFGLKMDPIYYWTVIPVITLVAAIPISPQGAGVMEAFAVLLTKNHGVTVSQAIALAMAVRFAQMFWNLLAGLFVLRGGYHAPTVKEQQDLETDDDEPGEAGNMVKRTPSVAEPVLRGTA
jgi:uncharacterized protein (TIRG00374 family)